MDDKKNVMILEDNVIMRSLLQTLLELENFSVCIPTFPINDPIQIIRDLKPDVIVLDIHLPGVNGLSLLALIRDSSDLNGTRVIVSSGSDRKDESLAAGADAFIMKPFMPDELINIIKLYTS
jgi:DNA-binding response OmpR family regulator